MSPLLALLCFVPAAYSLPEGRLLTYEMSVAMDGFLPLLGGQQATCDLKLGVRVSGLKPDAEGRLQASSELTSMKVFFNGAELPFGLENIKAYFPKTTVSLSPQGKVLKSDAPETSLPVRLPGLDVKRFPEISYLPIEFPDGGIEEGKPWSFERTFNGSKIAYTCDLKGVKDDLAEIGVTIEQNFETLEDASAQVVKDPKDALNKVVTSLKGKGTVWFDLKRGLAKEVSIEALASGMVTDLKSGKTSERKLKTTLKVKLAGS